MRIQNKRVSFDYEFLEKFEAGIKLVGTEVKSIKNNKCSINEAFCYFKDGELFIKSMHVAPYEQSGVVLNHDVLRDKKLLLHKKELLKIEKGLGVKGNTVVPIKLYVNSKGLIKIEIALSKGKNTYDKRESIKAKDVDRDTKRELKNLK